MDRIPTKIKRKTHALFTLHFIVFVLYFEGTPLKICKIQPPDLLFRVVFISSYISRYQFSQKSGKCEMEGKKYKNFGKT